MDVIDYGTLREAWDYWMRDGCRNFGGDAATLLALACWLQQQHDAGRITYNRQEQES